MSTVKENGNEAVVAIVPEQQNEEIALSRSVSVIELEAESIVVETDEDYSTAAEFGRRVKQAASDVVEFFRPMKEDAYRAHKTVCDKEKTMLKPLINAEGVLKRTMGGYALRKERERKAAEEEARRRAREEANRKLAEAVAQEEAGNKDAAESAMLDAQMADSMSRNMRVDISKPKAEGVSTTKDWEIVSINALQVPINFSGMELRPVDEKAVIRLIRASKGAIQIPGVTYKEVAKMSIRR
jgi:hypothetical protein